MLKKLSAIMLALLMLLSAAGCSITEEAPANSFEEADGSKDDGLFETPDVTSGSISSIGLEKVGSVEKKNINHGSGGLYYQEGELYGVMSFDGEYDTGAKYEYCSPEGLYFRVAEKRTEGTEPGDVNNMGLINAMGEIIVPMEYAVITAENYRYVRAFKATESTDNKDEALVYLTDSWIHSGAKDGDLLYKGEWQVYDALEKKEINGIKGTNKYAVNAWGGFLEYTNDTDDKVVINYNGDVIPAGAQRYAMADCYSVEADGVLTMYTVTGDKLFEMNMEGKSISSLSSAIYNTQIGRDTYFLVREKESDTCYLVDFDGKKASGDFTGPIYYYDGFIRVEATGNIYDLNANVLVKGNEEFETVEPYKETKQLCLVEDSKISKIIDLDGKVLFEKERSDELITSSYNVPRIKTDNGYMYYSFKDGDFIYKGYDCISWFVRLKVGENTFSLVDPFTGNTVIEGAARVSEETDINSGITYIYVENENGTDIYKMTVK
ncbi:MAG: hypothetical protein IJA55_04830 [Clostridia bacterium]|nr:hypothetical protein [Clostridia bacterium]